MSTTYSFFNSTTGEVLPGQKTLEEAQLAANTPEGFSAYVGTLNHLLQRVNVADGTIVAVQPAPPPIEDGRQVANWNEQSGRWDLTATLSAAKQFGSTQIDAVAGAARLRYITDVPGQQAVYLQKSTEAQAYKDAGYAGDVPPYISAESAATGMSAQEAADRILAIASSWGNELSPSIERLRISGKQALAAAIDEDSAREAYTSTINALNAI